MNLVQYRVKKILAAVPGCNRAFVFVAYYKSCFGSRIYGFNKAQRAKNSQMFVALTAKAFLVQVVCNNRRNTAVFKLHRN